MPKRKAVVNAVEESVAKVERGKRIKKGSVSASVCVLESKVAPTAESVDSKKGYFLMKSEPNEFSIDQLLSMRDKISGWEGVRNGQARNILTSMKEGDSAFFYHSSDGKRTGIYGTVTIVKSAYEDPAANIPSHKYYDPRNRTAEKKWVSVDVQLSEKWDAPLLLTHLKEIYNKSGSPLSNMMLFRNSRLSVQTVTPEEWEFILSLKNSSSN